MIGNASVLAVIPARGGSKGIPRKNIKEICGKPLLAWTIEAAKRSQYIDRLILSSDDAAIIETARVWGCEAPFVRPAELARDETPGMDVVLHAMERVPGFDYLVLLQPTSPLRTTTDIDRCIEACVSSGAGSTVSVFEPHHNPHWMYTLSPQGHLHSLLKGSPAVPRRQELPAVFALNGAVYVAESRWLKDHKTFLHEEARAYVMPAERSLDIDSPLDWITAEAWMKHQQNG